MQLVCLARGFLAASDEARLAATPSRSGPHRAAGRLLTTVGYGPSEPCLRGSTISH